MSTLRARCPDCRTLTAVAIGPQYECHSCGRSFAAGLVRVPRAWGVGGHAMAEAAAATIPYPEAAVVACDTLEEQTTLLAASLPECPLVLGGCCCAHTGAIAGLGARHERLAVVWLDAHGDLNTPENSPSGNAWGMALRAAIDAGSVSPGDVALVGARNLDPPEQAYLVETGIDGDVTRATAGANAVYVALDIDVLDPAALASFFPEPDGMSVDEVDATLRGVAGSGVPVAGMGVTGFRPESDIAVIARLVSAAGL